MLYYTSGLFGTVAMHSAVNRYDWITHAFIILTYLSTLNWMGKKVDYKLKRIILYADRFTGHIITIGLIIDSYQYKITYNILGFYCCLLYTIVSYYSGLLNTPKRHATLHIISCLGSHLLIYEKSLHHPIIKINVC